LSAAGHDASDSGGYFRLDRLDDCRDHLRSIFPDFQIKEAFRDLEVIGYDAFLYGDDSRALTCNARDLEAISTYDLAEFSAVAGKAFYELRELNEKLLLNQQVDFDDLAGVMATIADTYPPNRMTPAIKASLERWAMRPMEFSGP
jgi:hypothetical protein